MFLQDGLYVTYAGEEFPLVRDHEGQYRLYTPLNQADFERHPEGSYCYWLGGDEWFDCFEYRTHGTYLGHDVVVEPRVPASRYRQPGTYVGYDVDTTAAGVGALVVYTVPSDGDSRGAHENLEWIVQPDNPDLTMVTTRTRVTPPWIDMTQANARLVIDREGLSQWATFSQPLDQANTVALWGGRGTWHVARSDQHGAVVSALQFTGEASALSHGISELRVARQLASDSENLPKPALSPSVTEIIEHAGLGWTTSKDGTWWDIGTSLSPPFDRWIVNPDGSVDQFSARERAYGFDHEAWFSSWSHAEKWIAYKAVSSATRDYGFRDSWADDVVHPRCTLLDDYPYTLLLIDGGLAAKRMSLWDARYASHVLTQTLEDIVARYWRPDDA